MLSEHGAFTGIKIITLAVCLFTIEGTCIYYPTENKEPVLVPDCFISTTLLSLSIAETSSSTEAKNGSACLPTIRWLEARVLWCNFFLCPSLSHGGKEPICTAHFLHCPSFPRKSTRNPPSRCCSVGSEFILLRKIVADFQKAR